MDPLVSVVIPALNEERNIGWVLARLPACVDEVIVVDGNSSDDTAGAARRARPDVRVLCEPRPGKGVAVRTGLAAARGSFIVLLDADGSMDPLEIPRFVAALHGGHDLVKGSRFMAHAGTADISPVRAWGNRSLLRVANGLYGTQFSELCYGFMALRRSVVTALSLTAHGFEIEAQIVAHAMRTGLVIGEVPSFELARRSGESQLRTVRDGARVLRELAHARLRSLPEFDDAPAAPLVPLPLTADAGL